MRMALKPLILVTAPWGTNCPDLTSTLNAFLREVFKNKEPARVTSPRKPCPLTNTSLRRGCCAARESGAIMAALILSDTLMCLSCSRLRRPSRPRGAEQWPETCWRGRGAKRAPWHCLTWARCQSRQVLLGHGKQLLHNYSACSGPHGKQNCLWLIMLITVINW